MSSTTSSMSSSPPMTLATPPESPECDSGDSGVPGESQFGLVIGFSDHVTELWSGPGQDCLAIDTSGSIGGQNELLERAAVAALLHDSPAAGAFTIPEPCGGTAIIDAAAYCLEKKNGTLFIVSDGGENCWTGNLAVGTEEDGSEKMVCIDFQSTPSAAVLADHLQHIGAKVCILGIGEDAKPMVTEMLGRKNVFCGHVSTNNVKEIVATVRTLKRVSTGKSGSSITRNGIQHALLLPMNEDVQQSIKDLTPAEMDKLDETIGRIPIKNGPIVCSSDLKSAMDEILANYDETLAGHEADIRAALLLAMEEMCNGPRPAAMISSKHGAVIGVPQGWREFRRHCNRLFSRMAAAKLVQRESAVGQGGIELENNGHKHRFSAGCAQYSCHIPVAAITGLSEYEDYCTARSKLPAPKIKKRKRDSNGQRKKKIMRVD